MLQKAIFQHKEQLLNLYYILNILSVHVCVHICVCVCAHGDGGGDEGNGHTSVCVCAHGDGGGMREMV